MARYRDDGEVQIDNSTKVHFRNAFQQLIMIAALNVGTLLGQYLEAMILYRKASNEMLAFTKDGERQHLVDAQGMSVTASEDILRAGELLWPGQYKPH